MKDNYELDFKIKEVVSRNEALPETVREKTQLAYKEIRGMKKQHKKTTKKKWLVAAGLLVASTFALQTPLMADIKELLFGGEYTGVESAIEKGELQPFEGIISESNGIKLEVVGGLIDPTVIHLRMQLTAEDPALLKRFKYNEHTVQLINQFNITDNQGRVLQEIGEDGVYVPPYINEQGEEIHLVSSSTEQVNTRYIQQGKVEIDMILNSSMGSFEAIEGLTLQSNQLNKFKGDWELEVAFAPKDDETPQTVYDVVIPNDQVEITSAVAITTGIKIDCIVKAPVDENVISSQLVGADGSIYTTGRPGWMEPVAEGERVGLTFDVLEEEIGERFTLKIPTLNGSVEEVVLSRVGE